MAGASANLLRHVHQLVATHQIEQLTDHQLLERFAAKRDEAAFALLVRRHGPMVFGLCQRLLRHVQDAEDAFQAAFLILARKAGSIRQADVGGWIYRVAYRLAVRAHANAVKRDGRDKQVGAASRVALGSARLAEPTAPDPMMEVTWREVRQVVDAELQRLPDGLRSAVVLCYLEGKTHEEAARLLGWSKNTLRRRLERGRELLRTRLLARGLAPATALTATLFAVGTAPAAVSSMLAGETVRMALGSLVAPNVAVLVEVGCAILSVSKSKVATVILLAASLLGGAGLWACLGLAASNPGAPAQPAAAIANDKPASATPKREPAKSVEIQGRVLGPDGQPKAGAKLLLLGKDEKISELGVSAVDGRFTVAVAKEAKDQYLVAQSEGTGIDFLSLDPLKPAELVELRLVKDHAIRGRIVNTEGKPVAGVRVRADNLGVYPNNSLDSFLATWKKRQNVMSGLPNGVKHIWEGAGALFAATTDADGRFVLNGTGDERLVSLRLRGGDIAEVELWIVNRRGFDPTAYNEAVLINSMSRAGKSFGNRWRLYASNLSFVAEAGKTIRGVVKDADSGVGRPGVLVRLTRNGGELVSPIVQARTDAAGRYEIRGARKARDYMLEVSGDASSGHMLSQVHAADTAGYQPIAADIPVKRGVLVTGKMIDQATGKPVRGSAMIAVLVNNPFAKKYPEFNSSAWIGMTNTDAEGRFRVVAIPGAVLLMGGPDDYTTRFKYKSPAPDAKYPQYFNNLGNGFAATYYGLGGHFSPVQGTFCKVLEIKPDAKVVQQDIVLERASVLPVQIRDADGKPLAGAWVTGQSPETWHYPTRCAEADCSAYEVQPRKPRLMVFFHTGRKLAGTLTLKGDEKQPVVKLGPAGAVKGRLLDADGKPLAGVVVNANYRNREAREVHDVVHKAKQVVTDETGVFALDELIPELKLELTFQRGKRRFEREPKPADSTIQVKPGESRDLGAIRLKLVPEGAGE